MHLSRAGLDLALNRIDRVREVFGDDGGKGRGDGGGDHLPAMLDILALLFLFHLNRILIALQIVSNKYQVAFMWFEYVYIDSS